MISYRLIECLNLLVDQQQVLAESVYSEAHSIWMPGLNPAEDEKYGEFYATSEHPHQLQQAINAINNIEFIDGQEGRETQKQKGVVLIGPNSIKAAYAINETKVLLGQEFQLLRKQLSKNVSMRDVVDQEHEIRKILTRAGVSRLCLNQAKRKIPLAERAPFRISWLEKRSASIRRVTVDEAENKLRKLTSEQAHIDLQKLSRITGDSNLAIVQPANTPTIKANLFYKVVTDEGVQKLVDTIHAPMPILCATGNVIPRINKGGNRKNTKRSDVKIHNEVFLPSIRAHLYISE